MLYEEIRIIEEVKSKGDRVRLILMYIGQYNQLLHKLNSGDMTEKANEEAFKCHEHIKKLEDMILKECGIKVGE